MRGFANTARMRVGFALTVLGLACAAGSAPTPNPSRSARDRALPSVSAIDAGDRFDRVVIDAGHGGEDEGARGRAGLEEKTVVLDVAQRLAAELEAQGLRVIMTRKDDSFVPLEKRTSIANDARADLFVSIHANSAKSARPRGIETYFVSLDATDEAAQRVALRENEAFGAEGVLAPSDDPLSAIIGDMANNENERESSAFARLTQESLAKSGGGRSRGVKQAPFVVLMGVQMPAVLVELGFISNPDEERELRRPERRQAMASAIARAVQRYGRRYDAKRGLARD